MTVAVCLKCGGMKHGALTPCPECKHMPQDDEDKARHVMTSDHFFSNSDLEAISERVQSGKPLHFDPKQVEEFVAAMAISEPHKNARRFTFVLFALILAVFVGAIYMLISFVG